MTETNVTDLVPGDFYRAFEERFRGSQELIAERLKAYLPFLRAMRAQTDSPKGLDLGCGRGEWLQLLESEGFEARGVDLDDGMLQAAVENGLSVENKDAIAALVETEEKSLDVVSGFHIIEHLSFPTRLALIREAFRTLRPGGLLILETPNPENIHVGTWSFYLDPTHIAPIPPMLMPFLAEYAGFAQSVILRLNTPPPGDEPTLLDVYTKVAGDYALVARTGGAENLLMDQAFNTNVGLDIFGALNRYDALLQEGIEKKIKASQSCADTHLQEKITEQLLVHQPRNNMLMEDKISKELEAFHSQLKSLNEEMERLKPRPLWQKLFFRRSGRPKKFVRRLAFHSNGRPRSGVLGRIALNKDGAPRPAFTRWMTSMDYAALPWSASQTIVPSNAVFESSTNTVLVPLAQTDDEYMRGPNPATHPERFQVWARLDAAQRHGRN